MKKLNSPEPMTNAVAPLVAVGAAVGGAAAMTELLRTVLPDSGVAFVYFQYPGEDEAAEIVGQLSGVTAMAVEEVRRELPVVPNRVYVVPSDRQLQVSGGRLSLAPAAHGRGEEAAIDKFFSVLAHSYKWPLTGILMSGGKDGVAGLKAIKIAGGTTFMLDEMVDLNATPDAALTAGVVDLVLSAPAIAHELNKMKGLPDALMQVQLDSGVVSDTDESLLKIIQLLRRSTGLDFTHYKISTIKRRIIRRTLLYKFGDLKAYYEYLSRHANEITLLYQDLLIGVTCFFRDADSMEYLRKTVLPQLFKGKSTDEQVRIWVPACSTGEEAYSLAILIAEFQEESESKIPIQIFGTDLSETAISKARLGVYSPADLADMSDVRRARFFVRTENNNCRVHKHIRDLCVFAQHNLFKDPPFSRLDLISCCNFFIYLDNVLQQRSAALFYYALNPNGYLVLGKSEAVGSNGQQLFSQVEKRFKVYRKKPNGSPKVMAEINYRLPTHETRHPPERKRPGVEAQAEISGMEKTVDDILYARYIPAAVVINQEMEIVQFRGSTNLYLEPSRGKASFNLMKMARPGLTFDLRNCIHKAQTTRNTVQKAGVRFKVKDQEYTVALKAIPIPSHNEDRLTLVIFEEQQAQRQDGGSDFSRDEFVGRLQEELTAVRNDMQAIIDEHEANKEELQSANEEIISSNEELQSINEELETSKEEVESANEELTAINAELQMSNDQLLESNEYSEAIFATIREGVLVLNKDLRVKMANAAFYQAFQTEPHKTEGRLLNEIGDGQWDTAEIKDLLGRTLLHGRQFDGYEMRYLAPSHGVRTILMNGRKVVQRANKQELMLLAFEDITDKRRAEVMKSEREEWFRNMANNAPVMIWTAGPDGLQNFFNVTWLTYTGRSVDQEMAEGWINDIFPADKEAFLSVYYRGFEERKAFSIDYRLRRHDGEYRWVRAMAKPTFSPDEQFTGFVGICTEIHDEKLAHVELERLVSLRTHDLQQANKELKKSNTELQQFAYVASHDLQEPLRKIMIFSDRLTAGGELTETKRAYIGKIAGSAQRMSQLIHDLLDFSRATRTRDRIEATDLGVILKTVLTDFDLLIKEKNALLVAEMLPVVEAIPLQMEQLFHNLISNALKFSKEHTPPVIRISGRRLPKDEVIALGGLDKQLDYVELVFEDNGIGFSNEYAEQIFVLFQRLNGRHEYPGTGIGLALCRKIVDNHGGRIFAHSLETIHTQFHIVLPVKQAPAEG